jgi:polar amino acid transport system permease protein
VKASFNLDDFINFTFHPSDALLGGLVITILAALVAQLMGVMLGIIAALGGRSRNPVFSTISGFYVWVFRGTPVLVQIMLLFNGLPVLLGVDLFPRLMSLGPIDLRGAIVAGICALGVNEGAYMSEIVRAGILSVDPGQGEAAKSLGMTPRQTMQRIILPQALRVIIPPLGNEFNNMLKTTSLMSTIGVLELLRVATDHSSTTFRPFEPLLGVSIYYLALTTIWGVVQGRIEKRLGVGQASADAARGFWARMLGMGRGRQGETGGVR